MLTNKIILITGASRGIGRAVAKALAAANATVILLSRTVSDLESLYDEIVAANYPKPMLCPFNLCTATPTDYDDLRRNIANTYGRLDGLIHNAGILGDLTPIEHYNLQTWYKVLQVNLNSQFLLTQACMPLLKQAPDASVVFTVSKQARNPKANWGAYAVANAGSLAMMQMLAEECENLTKIRINAVQPENVDTALMREAYPSKRQLNQQAPQDLIDVYVALMHTTCQASGQIFTSEKQLSNTGSELVSC